MGHFSNGVHFSHYGGFAGMGHFSNGVHFSHYNGGGLSHFSGSPAWESHAYGGTSGFHAREFSPSIHSFSPPAYHAPASRFSTPTYHPYVSTQPRSYSSLSGMGPVVHESPRSHVTGRSFPSGGTAGLSRSFAYHTRMPPGGSASAGYNAAIGSFSRHGSWGHEVGDHHGEHHGNEAFEHEHFRHRFPYAYGTYVSAFPFYGSLYPYYFLSLYPYYYNYGLGYPYTSEYVYGPEYYSYYGSAYVPPETPYGATEVGGQAAVDQAGETYLAQAEAAFRGGDYDQAIRLASHAAIEMPQDGRVHEILWLALFAKGDYEGSAIEAHAVMQSGLSPTWSSVSALYGNPEDFTPQLRALEAYAEKNADSPFATFLLGYQYVVLGDQAAALPWLERAVSITPQDELAAKLVQSLGGTVPAAAAKPEAAPPAPKAPHPATP